MHLFKMNCFTIEDCIIFYFQDVKREFKSVWSQIFKHAHYLNNLLSQIISASCLLKFHKSFYIEKQHKLFFGFLYPPILVKVENK